MAREMLRIARNLVSQRNYREAQDLLVQAVSQNPRDLALRACLAELYYRTERLWEAEQMANELLADSPGYEPALTVKGNVAFRRGRLDEALLCFEAADAGKPSPYLAQRIARCLEGLGRLEEAISFLQRRLHGPGGTRLKQAMARLCEKAGKSREAAMRYVEVAREDPANEFAFAQMVKLGIRGKPLEAALQEIGAILKLGSHSRNPHLMALKGQVLLDLGRNAEAKDCFAAALKIDPSNNYLRSMLGFALRRNGELEEASKVFESVLLENPGNQHVRSSYIADMRKLGKAEAALNFFIELSNRHPDYRPLLGIMKKLRKETEDGSWRRQLDRR